MYHEYSLFSFVSFCSYRHLVFQSLLLLSVHMCQSGISVGVCVCVCILVYAKRVNGLISFHYAKKMQMSVALLEQLLYIVE